jgi:hypothetical protein
MEYIEINEDKVIKYDDKNSKALVFSKKATQARIEEIDRELNETPTVPTDEELLRWAKENYSGVDYGPKTEYLKAEKTRLEEDLRSQSVKLSSVQEAGK